MNEPLSFEEVTETLTRIGVPFVQAHDWGKQGTEVRHEFKVPLLTSIGIQMSSDEWVQTCSRDGDFYIGGCCGTTAAAQDIMQGVFRDERYIPAEDFAHLAALLTDHDPMAEEPFTFQGTIPRETLVGLSVETYREDLTPWAKMAFLWQLTRDHLLHKVPTPVSYPDPLKESYRVVSSHMMIFRWESIFDRHDESKIETERRSLVKATQRGLVIPHLRRVLEAYEALPQTEVLAYGIVHLDKESLIIADVGSGPMVYPTEEDAKRVFRSWLTAEEKGEEYLPNRSEGSVFNRFGIRPVQVSSQTGFQILDAVPTPEVK